MTCCIPRGSKPSKWPAAVAKVSELYWALVCLCHQPNGREPRVGVREIQNSHGPHITYHEAQVYQVMTKLNAGLLPFFCVEVCRFHVKNGLHAVGFPFVSGRVHYPHV